MDCRAKVALQHANIRGVNKIRADIIHIGTRLIKNSSGREYLIAAIGNKIAALVNIKSGLYIDTAFVQNYEDITREELFHLLGGYDFDDFELVLDEEKG